MKFGHHGGNHPVKDIDNNVVMITAQNHGFAVDEATLPANLRVTHQSLFDGTCRGSIVPTNRRSASRGTLKRARGRTMPRRCSTTLSS